MFLNPEERSYQQWVKEGNNKLHDEKSTVKFQKQILLSLDIIYFLFRGSQEYYIQRVLGLNNINDWGRRKRGNYYIVVKVKEVHFDENGKL